VDEPLVREFVVTTALTKPAAVGRVVRFTVSDLVVAAVIVPIAPFVSATVLLTAVGSKPNPLIVNVVTLAARLTALLVITGVTEAT
jgi:hypothetical protein